MKSLVYELWRVGMLSQFTIFGSKLKGIYSIRSKKLGSEVHNLWHATITGEGEINKATEVAWALKKYFGKVSVQDAASSLIKKTKWLEPNMIGDLRHRTGYLGGIQWCPREVESGQGRSIQNAYYADLEEAYVNCLLKRQMPKRWAWSKDTSYPTEVLADQDGLFWVEATVPEYLPWGFPITRETINGKYAGVVTGEEIISAQIPENHIRILGRWVPQTWGPHPAVKVLDMPRIVRKRVGITIYGLHAKREERTKIMVSDKPIVEPGMTNERFRDAYLVWYTESQRRPFARLDYAALTTSRVRSAVVRALLDMPEAHMVYVDGIIADQVPQEDTMWPGIIKWNIKASGECTVWGPGVYHFDGGEKTTKRGSALKEYLLRVGN